MSIHLNKRGYDHATELAKAGRVVLDDRDAWSAHRPTSAQENDFIASHGWGDYSRWHLGVDDAQDPETKSYYKFPYGDFRDVHRCAVLSAESRAAQYKHDDVQQAAAHLHGMLEGRAAATG